MRGIGCGWDVGEEWGEKGEGDGEMLCVCRVVEDVVVG
jgi:hypothetical protein